MPNSQGERDAHHWLTCISVRVNVTNESRQENNSDIVSNVGRLMDKSYCAGMSVIEL
jgi:hypothetical protein